MTTTRKTHGSKVLIGLSLLGLLLLLVGLVRFQIHHRRRSITTALSRLNPAQPTVEQALHLLGAPEAYQWEGRRFTSSTLPPTFLMQYPQAVSLMVHNGVVSEIRFDGPGISLSEGIQVGQTEAQLWLHLKKPTQRNQGGPSNRFLQPGIFFENLDGIPGKSYYADPTSGYRIFLSEGKVTSVYKQWHRQARASVQSVPLSAFVDARSRTVNTSCLPEHPSLLASMTFNQDTVWPDGIRDKAMDILNQAKDPRLRIRELHHRGITGHGIRVGIIDQALNRTHSEYSGKIIAYRDFGCIENPSMHGPAVASLLLGNTVGTAPGAEAIYAAVNMMSNDATSFSRALDWILEQNRELKGFKIKFVSVSAAPSGRGSRFTNPESWDAAVARAAKEGVLVFDCTGHQGKVGAAYFEGSESGRTKMVAGFPGLPRSAARPGRIHAPASGRTLAEEISGNGNGFAYYGRGGLSWAVPYVVGVLALAQQVNPEMEASQLWSRLQASSTRHQGHRFVNPSAFISLLLKRTPKSTL